MKILLRTSVFVLTAVLTWAVTSALRAQSPVRSGSAAPNIAMSPDETTQTTTEDDGGNPPVSQARLAAPTEQTGLIEMHRPDIFALAGLAVINSGVTMNLRATTTKFVWHVRILDRSATKVVDQKLYDHQAFQTNPDGTHTSTFGDMVPLPPGRSRVQLRLYAVPSDYDTSLLLNEKNSQQRMVLQDFKDVENH